MADTPHLSIQMNRGAHLFSNVADSCSSQAKSDGDEGQSHHCANRQKSSGHYLVVLNRALDNHGRVAQRRGLRDLVCSSDKTKGMWASHSLPPFGEFPDCFRASRLLAALLTYRVRILSSDWLLRILSASSRDAIRDLALRPHPRTSIVQLKILSELSRA